jgi:hypothetical protein
MKTLIRLSITLTTLSWLYWRYFEKDVNSTGEKRCTKCLQFTDDVPEIVPWMVVPFFNSMVTVSLFSFIKNLQRCTTRGNVLVQTPKKGNIHDKGKDVRYHPTWGDGSLYSYPFDCACHFT